MSEIERTPMSNVPAAISRVVSSEDAEDCNENVFSEDEMNKVYDAGFVPYVVFWIINRGQHGINKIMGDKFFHDFSAAQAYLETVDPVLRPHTVVRCGMMLEGPTVEEARKEKIPGLP